MYVWVCRLLLCPGGVSSVWVVIRKWGLSNYVAIHYANIECTVKTIIYYNFTKECHIETVLLRD